MRLLLTGLLSLTLSQIVAQSANQQKAYNNFIEFLNQSADEMASVTKAAVSYHQNLSQRRNSSVIRFNCPVQPEEYYAVKAVEGGVALGVAKDKILGSFTKLKQSTLEVDRLCKALDTYHKLEDYKRDDYAEGKKLTIELLTAIEKYGSLHDNFQLELAKQYQSNYPVSGNYARAAGLMHEQLVRERTFLLSWKLNINEKIHTGFNIEGLVKHINESADAIARMQAVNPSLNYPASSMWPSFIEGLQSMIDLKRHALDRYNHEQKQSDRHFNMLYNDLINYYNGVLVANYNSFVDFATGDKFYGLKAAKFVGLAENRTQSVEEHVSITRFRDTKFIVPNATVKTQPISPPQFVALRNYVDFINETFRAVSHQRDLIRNLSSSASYYAGLSSFSGRGGMSFRHEGFVIPYSLYHKSVHESKSLDREWAESLNDRARVILEILEEMDQIAVTLEQHIGRKDYEKDRCKQVYELIQRTKVLYETWDEKKEDLFMAARALYDAYPLKDKSASWALSGNALWDLVTEDRSAVFAARDYYKGATTSRPSVEDIEKKIRNVLSSEYDNMKGIQKLGRNNGNCPYTPYEDLPKYSRSLAEVVAELKPVASPRSGTQHPYHRIVYHYNDVVQSYNKFASLSPILLLPSVKQPELFEITYPQETSSAETKPVSQRIEQPTAEVAASKPETPSSTPQTKTTEKTVMLRDTVYIHQRDTIYLHDSFDDRRSMDGYATNNLVLLLDVSGSMNAPDKLPLLKKSLIEMIGFMRAEDEIAIVVFSGKPSVLLKPTSFRQDEKIKKAIQSLKPSGTTDANAGLKMAYRVADENYVRGGNNRIILATDGQFAISEESRKLISDFSRQDIMLSVFNFGKSNSASKSLQDLAATGHGYYYFIAGANVDLNLLREVKAKRKN